MCVSTCICVCLGECELWPRQIYMYVRMRLATYIYNNFPKKKKGPRAQSTRVCRKDMEGYTQIQIIKGEKFY